MAQSYLTVTHQIWDLNSCWNVSGNVDTVGLSPPCSPHVPLVFSLFRFPHPVCVHPCVTYFLPSVLALRAGSSGSSLVWLVGSCAPQLLIDLSEYVNLTSAVVPALPHTQRQPPKPPPVSTNATPAGELVSNLTDQLDRLVRICVASSVCLITNGTGKHSCLCSYIHIISCLIQFWFQFVYWEVTFTFWRWPVCLTNRMIFVTTRMC